MYYIIKFWITWCVLKQTSSMLPLLTMRQQQAWLNVWVILQRLTPLPRIRHSSSVYLRLNVCTDSSQLSYIRKQPATEMSEVWSSGLRSDWIGQDLRRGWTDTKIENPPCYLFGSLSVFSAFIHHKFNTSAHSEAQSFLFFSFRRQTHDPQQPELAIMSLVLDQLCFIHLVICHTALLCLKNSLSSLQSGLMEVLHLQLNVSFYLTTPLITHNGQIMQDKHQTLIAAKITGELYVSVMTNTCSPLKLHTSARGEADEVYSKLQRDTLHERRREKYEWNIDENRKGRNGAERQGGWESRRGGNAATAMMKVEDFPITGLSQLNLLIVLLEAEAPWAVCVSSVMAVGYDRHQSGSSWQTASAANGWTTHCWRIAPGTSYTHP